MKSIKLLITLVLILLTSEIKAEYFYTFYFYEINLADYPIVKIKGAVKIEEFIELGFSPKYTELTENGRKIDSISIINKTTKNEYLFFELVYTSNQKKQENRLLSIKYNQGGFHNLDGDTYLFIKNTTKTDKEFINEQRHYIEYQEKYDEIIKVTKQHYQTIENESEKPYAKIKTIGVPIKVEIYDTKSENNGYKLDKNDWKNYGFNTMQEYYNDSEYQISGQLRLKANHLLIIEKNYETENNKWICILNNEQKIIDWLEIAYDNAEGCCNTESIIYKDSVAITEYNIYTKPEKIKKSYLITPNGFKPKVKYIVIAKSGLVVRQEPSLTSTKIGKIPFGNQINIIRDTKKNLAINDEGKEINGTWLKIKLKNPSIHKANKQYYGYVFSGFTKQKK